MPPRRWCPGWWYAAVERRGGRRAWRLNRDQCHSQGRSLVWFQRLHPRCVERPGLVGEVLHLHGEDVGQGGSADRLRRQPSLTDDQVAQVTQCWISGVGLELIPWRP